MTDGQGQPSPVTLENHAILEALGDAVVVADGDNRIVWVNHAASQLLGWQEDALVGLPLVTLMPERFRDLHIAAFERFVQTNEPRIMGRPVRVPALRRDGVEVPIELVLNPLRSGSGPEPLVVASIRDMSDHLELELQAQVVSRLLGVMSQGGTLAEAAPLLLEAIADSLDWSYAGLWVVDWHDRLVLPAGRWQAAEMTSQTFKEVSQRTVFRVGEGLPGRVVESGLPLWVPDVLQEPNFPRRAAAMADGVRTALVFPILSAGRVWGAIELLSIHQRDEQGQMMQIMASIGEQLGSFVEQRLADEVLRVSRQRLDLALQAGRMTTWQWDLAADSFHWFDAGMDFVDAEGRAGVSLSEGLRYVHEEDRARVEAVFRSAAGARTDLHATYRVAGHDGGYHWIEISGRITRDAGGRALLAGIATDVTDRVESERHQQALLEEVQASRERLELLSDAGSLLASSLDYHTTLGHVARLSVPRLADKCVIHGVRDDGSIELLAVAHRSDGAVGPIHAIHERFPDAVGQLFDLGKALTSGEALLHATVTPELLNSLAVDEQHLAALEALGWKSVVVAPLEARGRIVGALTWAMGSSGRIYNQDDLAFAKQLAARAALAVDNARLYEDQATTARTLQESLLPPHLPAIPGVEVAADYRPAGRNQVAGDFYDLFPLRGDSWGIVVGDVRGKGAGAAAVTALARWTVRAAAMQSSSPPKVLGLLNEAMLRRVEDAEDPRFCTAVFARMRPVEGGMRLTVSSGGHPLPMVLRRDGLVEELGHPGLIVGAFAEARWEATRVQLLPGDVVLIYTDGVSEARMSGGELFGEHNLRAVLKECAGLTASEIVERVVKQLDDNADSRDDVALLALRVRE